MIEPTFPPQAPIQRSQEDLRLQRQRRRYIEVGIITPKGAAPVPIETIWARELRARHIQSGIIKPEMPVSIVRPLA